MLRLPLAIYLLPYFSLFFLLFCQWDAGRGCYVLLWDEVFSVYVGFCCGVEFSVEVEGYFFGGEALGDGGVTSIFDRMTAFQ